MHPSGVASTRTVIVVLVVVQVLVVGDKNAGSAAGCREVEAVLKEVMQQGPGRKQVHKLQATLVRNYDRPTD